MFLPQTTKEIDFSDVHLKNLERSDSLQVICDQKGIECYRTEEYLRDILRDFFREVYENFTVSPCLFTPEEREWIIENLTQVKIIFHGYGLLSDEDAAKLISYPQNFRFKPMIILGNSQVKLLLQGKPEIISVKELNGGELGVTGLGGFPLESMRELVSYLKLNSRPWKYNHNIRIGRNFIFELPTPFCNLPPYIINDGERFFLLLKDDEGFERNGFFSFISKLMPVKTGRIDWGRKAIIIEDFT